MKTNPKKKAPATAGRTKGRIDFKADLRALHAKGNAMLAYLEKHPDEKDVRVWRPVRYDGQRDMTTWDTVQDRFGKIIIGCNSPKKIGADYDFGPFILGYNSPKGLSILKQRTVNVLGRIIAQVSMKDAQQLAGMRLPHKPYCYEVIVD